MPNTPEGKLIHTLGDHVRAETPATLGRTGEKKGKREKKKPQAIKSYISA